MLLLPLIACGDGGASERAPTATIDTLPNGAVLVRNDTVGAWTAEEAWTFREDVRIGSIEGSGPDVFSSVHGLAVDDLGRVWVLDRQGKRIEVFEADGSHVRTVGRSGGGPGEFEAPTGMLFDDRGRLWVEDGRNARYSVFDTTGAFLTSYPRQEMFIPWTWNARFVDGGLMSEGVRRVEGGPSEDVLIRRDSAAAARDTFELPAFEPDLYRVEQDGRLMMTMNVPYSPTRVWRVRPDGMLWFGTTGDYRLHQRTLDGDTLRIVDRVWTPVPVRPAERDSFFEQEFLVEMRRGGAELDPERVPANKPAWASFTFDDRGHLWVFPVLGDGTARAADVFDPRGVFLGRVSLPDRMSLDAPAPVVRGNRVYAAVRDELDVSYVMIGTLLGRSGGDSPATAVE